MANPSRDHKEVPPYTILLEFLDLWAYASKNIVHEDNQKRNTSGYDKKLGMK